MNVKIYGLILLIFFIGLMIFPDEAISLVTNIPLDNTSQDGYVKLDEDAWDGKNRLRVGDNNDTNVMAFIGINLDRLPICNITSATLFFYIFAGAGDPDTNNPYKMDHVDFGPDFTPGEESSPAMTSNFFTYTYTNDQVWVAVPVTAQLAYDYLNKKAWTLDGSDRWFQVRMRASNISTNFETNDNFSIRSTDTTNTNQHPILIVYYELAPHLLSHFTISHDTSAYIDKWNRITITAKNSNDLTISTNIGTITVDVAVANGVVTWANANNCGTYSNISDKVVYTFNDCENGVVTLYIKDDRVDTVNIEVISTISAITDNDTEGLLYFTDKFITNIEMNNNDQNIYVKQDDEFWDYKNHMHIGDKGETNFMAYIGINLYGLQIANIASATLFFYIYDDTGNTETNNPYKMDHVDFGSNFTMGEEYLQAMTSNIFTYIYTNQQVWVAVPVTDQVIYDLINAKSWTLDGSDRWLQVRMRASNISQSPNNLNDYFSIRSSRASQTDEHPYLRVHYSLAPHQLSYFTISHDSYTVPDYWSRITITAKNSNDLTIWTNIGTITVDVTGASGSITWANANNCGTFQTNNNKAIYTFNGNGCE